MAKVIRVAPSVLKVLKEAGKTRQEFVSWVAKYGDGAKVNKQMADEFLEDQELEKTLGRYNVVLAEVTNKLKVSKTLRDLLGIRLKDAKELVERAPITVKAKVSKEKANQIKAALEAVGATVDLEEAKAEEAPKKTSRRGRPKKEETASSETKEAAKPEAQGKKEFTITVIQAGGRAQITAIPGQTIEEVWEASVNFTVRSAEGRALNPKTVIVQCDMTILVYKKDDGGVA